MLVDINFIIECIICAIFFALAYVCFDKLIGNADKWIRKKCDEDLYEKVSLGMAVVCILIIIIYGLSLVFKYV